MYNKDIKEWNPIRRGEGLPITTECTFNNMGPTVAILLLGHSLLVFHKKGMHRVKLDEGVKPNPLVPKKLLEKKNTEPILFKTEKCTNELYTFRLRKMKYNGTDGRYKIDTGFLKSTTGASLVSISPLTEECFVLFAPNPTYLNLPPCFYKHDNQLSYEK